jgi:hypothetical protein
MIAKAVGLTTMYALIVASPVLYQQPSPEATSDDEVLIAFVQLGILSDRGIVAAVVRDVVKSDVNAEANADADILVPRELLELLDIREKHLAKESPRVPWLIDVENHTPTAAIDRFRKYGLIELFHTENSKMLDYPLTERKELMDRIERITDQLWTTLSPLFAGKQRPTERRLILIAGQIRTLSVDVDMEILKSLSSTERVRLAKLVSYLLPTAIAEAKQSNRNYPLGSALLDTGRLPDRNSWRDRK